VKLALSFFVFNFVLNFGFGFSAFAQSSASISVDRPTDRSVASPTPEPTDEYGIPLKLKPKPKAPNQAVLSGMQDDASASVPAPKAVPTRRAPSRKAASSKKQTTKKKLTTTGPIAPEVLENQATKELMLPKEDLSQGVLPTPATVRSRVEDVKNPIRPLEYRLGVSLQPFTPKGTMAVGDLIPYDLSDAGTNAMAAIDAQWLPLSFENVAGLEAGAFASVGYAQFDLALRAPTGLRLEDTKLHAIKAQIGATASYQLPKSPLWSLHGNLGVGRMQLIQASPVSYANASSAVNFASLGVAAERSLLPKLSVYAGYDFRLALNRSSEGADVANHNVLLGFLGNFE
jgi:hypothetical protein